MSKSLTPKNSKKNFMRNLINFINDPTTQSNINCTQSSSFLPFLQERDKLGRLMPKDNQTNSNHHILIDLEENKEKPTQEVSNNAQQEQRKKEFFKTQIKYIDSYLEKKLYLSLPKVKIQSSSTDRSLLNHQKQNKKLIIQQFKEKEYFENGLNPYQLKKLNLKQNSTQNEESIKLLNLISSIDTIQDQGNIQDQILIQQRVKTKDFSKQKIQLADPEQHKSKLRDQHQREEREEREQIKQFMSYRVNPEYYSEMQEHLSRKQQFAMIPLHFKEEEMKTWLDKFQNLKKAVKKLKTDIGQIEDKQIQKWR